MRFLTQRHATVGGVSLVAVGVGLILVPGAGAGTSTTRETVAAAAAAAAHPADSVAPTTASLSFAAASNPAPSTSSPQPSSASPRPTTPSSSSTSSSKSPAAPPAPTHTSPPPVAMSSRAPSHPSSPPPVSHPPASSASPKPAASSNPAPAHQAGMLTNVGSGLSVGVVNGATADGSTMVTWHTDPSISDQHWTVVNSQYQGHSGLLFRSNLTGGSVMDLNVSSTQVALWHSLTGTNQLWWLAGSTVSGAFYIHNVMTSDCLTDNGLGSQLSVQPCVTGNKAQIWYLP